VRPHRRLIVLVLVAACGSSSGSFLGTELKGKVAAVDAKFRAGDAQGGCAALSALLPELYQWSETMRGARVAEIHRTLEQMSAVCMLQDPVRGWERPHADLVAATAHRSGGWGQVGWWALAFGVAVGVWWTLRRLRA
jgi:hypothetical protein